MLPSEAAMRYLSPLVAVFLSPLAAAAADSFTGKYCLGCHSAAARSGGFVLENASAAEIPRDAAIWEKAVKRVRAREMPPAGAPQPAGTEAAAFLRTVTGALDEAAVRKPYAGRAVIRRLNRTEYTNAVRDLLDIDLPLAAELPQDQMAAGFDNIADALTLSPLLLEHYLKVARRVSGLAAGTGDASPVMEIFPARGSQATWLGEGMPYGTRGGIRVTHYFPRTGDYDLRAFLARESLTPLEGVRFFRMRLTGVTAGSHNVVVTFPDEFALREGPVSDVGGPGGDPLGGPLDVLGTAVRPRLEFRLDGRRVKLFEIRGMNAGEAAFDGQPGPPALARIEIAGPYNAKPGGDTPSRRRLFPCRPETGPEAACVERILKPLARRAFRRDVDAAAMAPFLAAYARARKTQDFESSISAAVREILLAPDFLFRLEFDAAGGEPGAAQPVTGFELASRLSFFLWSSIPDDALLDAAGSGNLLTPGGLARQTRRLLADERSEALADQFAAQWLGLGALAGVEPDRTVFPAYDRGLKTGFQTETRLFLTSLIRENRPVLDLINARHTYLNDRLAAHYGVPGVTGPGFRRVALAPESGRGGVLTQGSVLMLTSHATRTSPVVRGKWILDNLLNSPPPPPPATVPPLDESPRDGKKLSTRQQVERHRAQPGCAGCHSRIDPLGFALENYDVLGRYRTHDGDEAIDPASPLSTGVMISGAGGLREHLASRAQELAHATVERLLTYALGRELDARDQPTVRRIVGQTERDGYRFQDLVVATVQSVPFRYRQKIMTQER
ncbi:MAG: DUF1592 domain-containing protein [Acidobacteria bacterium]|nr:DUF1592 domain-containing protein [Acidobacteriota bacterium]